MTQRIRLKSKSEISLLEKANVIVANLLELLKEYIKPGISTYDIDKISEEFIINRGAKPAFKGYGGFPGTVCASINDVVVHGIPSKKTILKEGDIITIDVGTIYEGYYGDSAWTYAVGNISEKAQKLMDVTLRSLNIGIENFVAGKRIGDLSRAIQEYVEGNGYYVIREYTGHGIGRNLHEPPSVPNYGKKGTGFSIMEGLTICIEPMVATGTWRTKLMRDGWTAKTLDGSLAAHYEKAVALVEGKPFILTHL
jgi:methionyl aminopeptidase